MSDPEIRPLAGQHIAVLIPSYDGRIGIEAMTSLISLRDMIDMNGGRMSIFSQKHMALIESARNALLATVMQYPDITGVLHLDADIEFDAVDALSLIAYCDDKYDMMAGLYRAKTDKKYLYFVTWDGEGDPVLDGEVLPCRRVPFGFVYAKRAVLDALWDRAADKPINVSNKPGRLVFETAYRGGTFIGEDYDFCDKVRDAGFRIGALPKIKLKHVGLKAYEGTFFDAIEAVKSGALEVIKEDDDAVVL